MKLSEKGFERRSERGIGRYIGAKIGRTVRCRYSLQLRFGCVQDFSDSFMTKFTWPHRPDPEGMLRPVDVLGFLSTTAPVRLYLEHKNRSEPANFTYTHMRHRTI